MNSQIKGDIFILGIHFKQQHCNCFLTHSKTEKNTEHIFILRLQHDEEIHTSRKCLLLLAIKEHLRNVSRILDNNSYKNHARLPFPHFPHIFKDLFVHY
jgi:hypothetical protein